jgi:hypothetical protein
MAGRYIRRGEEIVVPIHYEGMTSRLVLTLVFFLFVGSTYGQFGGGFNQVAQPLQPAPPEAVVIPLDLTRDSIYVVSKEQHPFAQDVRLEVGFTDELIEPQSAQSVEPASVVIHKYPLPPAPRSNRFLLQLDSIGVGDEYHAVFKAGIPNVTIGLRIILTVKGNFVRAEIQPRYILPDGSVQVLTKQALERTIHEYDQKAVQSTAVEAELQRLESELSSDTSLYDSAVAAASENAVKVRLTGNTKLARLKQHIEQLQQQVANLKPPNQVASTRLPDNSQIFTKIKEYIAYISPSACIYLRMHLGNTNVEAAIKNKL